MIFIRDSWDATLNLRKVVVTDSYTLIKVWLKKKKAIMQSKQMKMIL